MTANSKPTTKVQPTAKVALDLDALDREGAPDEPYSIRHHGRVYTFKDAQELDWQEVLASLRDPQVFFRLTLEPDDAKAFLGSETKVWKLRRLMDDYRAYHGMLEPGEAAASPTS